MNAKDSLIEPLLEKAEEYGKTSFELLKLKSIDKAADVSSQVISRLVIGIVVLIFTIFLNIAIALWLGDLLGKIYYGFLIVAAFYGIIGIILFSVQPAIKKSVNDSIIKKVFN